MPTLKPSFFNKSLPVLDDKYGEYLICINAELEITASLVDMKEIEKVFSFDNPQYLADVKYNVREATSPEKLQFFRTKTDVNGTEWVLLPRMSYLNKNFLSIFNPCMGITSGLLISIDNCTYKGETYVSPLSGVTVCINVGNSYLTPNLDLKINLTLRNYQESFISDYAKKVIDGCKQPYSSDNLPICLRNVLLNMPCGHGKTIASIYVASLFKKKTIIFVTTYLLQEQFASSILANIENVELYSKKGNTAEKIRLVKFDVNSKAQEILDADILIVTYNLYDKRKELFKSIDESGSSGSAFGTAIFDECHRVGAKTAYTSASHSPAQNRIALSATFRRKDGLVEAIKNCFGTPMTMQNIFDVPDNIMIDLSIPNCVSSEIGYEHTPFTTVCEVKWYNSYKSLFPTIFKSISGSFIFTPEPTAYDDGEKVSSYCLVDRLIFNKLYKKLTPIEQTRYASLFKSVMNDNFTIINSYMSEHPYVKEVTRKVISKLADSERSTLVISTRRSILEHLNETLPAQENIHTELVVGSGGKPSSLTINEDINVVLGIYQLAQEGLDSPHLDTLFLLNPSSDIEQSYGRIRRFKEGKKYPVVVNLFNYSFGVNQLVMPVSEPSRSIKADNSRTIHVLGLDDFLAMDLVNYK